MGRGANRETGRSGALLTLTPGMRIAQMVVGPVTRAEWEVVAELPITQRNTGGFGHSGTERNLQACTIIASLNGPMNQGN